MKKKKKNVNPQIMVITYLFTLAFMALIVYLCYFVQIQSDKVINNPYNKRQELLAKRVVRGSILSKDKEVLAKTVTDESGKETRYYPYGAMFCHVVGRMENSYTGIEQSKGFTMLNSSTNGLMQMIGQITGEKAVGDNVVTTLDTKLQEIAYEGLGSRKGAVVVMDPTTGKILAMVSKPDYDPNKIAEQWDDLVEDKQEESALINRATQGLYPPGSTFKTMTALAYIQQNKDTSGFHYDCGGQVTYGGNTIRCFQGEVHGDVNLKQAYAKSCNGAFATLGTRLDIQEFGRLCEKFLFNRSLPVDFEYNSSVFSLKKEDEVQKVTHTSIGQGETLISPLHNAMITAAIANNGVMMKPYVVDHVENVQGRTVSENKPEKIKRVISKAEAKKMQKLMKAVVDSGTAVSLSGRDYTAAGKTGTAEYDSNGSSHAWFTGYASQGKTKIVVSIIVEGAGTGSTYAVPIAGKLFDAYLK